MPHQVLVEWDFCEREGCQMNLVLDGPPLPAHGHGVQCCPHDVVGSDILDPWDLDADPVSALELQWECGVDSDFVLVDRQRVVGTRPPASQLDGNEQERCTPLLAVP